MNAVHQIDVITDQHIDVVTLRLGGEWMALPADCLREILEPVAVTRVPQSTPFSSGLINVRGVVVPLTDLKVAFGMPRTDPDADTRMLVLDLPLNGETITVAITADKVHEVTVLDVSTLDDVPSVGLRWPPEFVRGIGKQEDEFLLLPNLEAIFQQFCPKGIAAKQIEEGN
ncbi:chemotaxis protein CheW [Sagittula sp. NFXS13]|uniref:chemotaxis protein CheW n=1 Tax=Sagittula sp. NFXS13 TaxID=2819095 RepID=UPI0032DFB0F3